MREPATEARIREIYAETIDALYGFASRRCGGDRELAEDVTQETWLRAVREWRRSGIPDKPLAWLQVVARNLILNVLRRRGRVSLDDVTSAELIAALDEGRASESSEVASLVNHALDRLPEKQARLLEAFHFERFKVSQLAQALGMSERAVEGRLRRARESLRREIEAVLKAQGGLA
ncbi:MAG TPA: sigma-70 family RNA polymerase sigma factor [Gemmatimonadaceae bacterium]|nr:sigma-70 family RNA polymerase sigma factor [Gemmatimonadaceae bacterium]